MLQVGDQVLLLNNASLKNRPLVEVNQLLRANEEVVKLKVRKDEQYAEEQQQQLLDEKVVVYTVELQRNNGPLGITISGSDDLFEPLHVSGLTEGGLAERTNAIHVGDTILAINNVPLRGKSLTEAIELLKSSDDIVTLKISRKLELAQQQQQQQKQKTSLSYSSKPANGSHHAHSQHYSSGFKEDSCDVTDSTTINQNGEYNIKINNFACKCFLFKNSSPQCFKSFEKWQNFATSRLISCLLGFEKKKYSV
jgi:PDZ domain